VELTRETPSNKAWQRMNPCSLRSRGFSPLNARTLERMSSRIGNSIGQAFVAYPLPLIMAVFAWVPFDMFRGILFSAHGGLGWLLLLLSFPWLLVRATVLCASGPVEDRSRRRRAALFIVAGYVPISLLCAYSLMRALNPPLTNTLKTILPFLYFPAALLLPEAGNAL
jgi:hypothetical protein